MSESKSEPIEAAPLEPTKSLAVVENAVPNEIVDFLSQVNKDLPTTETKDNVEDDSNHRPDRTKTLTTKGRKYQLTNSVTSMKSCYKRLKKKADILLLLLDGKNVDAWPTLTVGHG